jgi:hypothetical protein
MFDARSIWMAMAAFVLVFVGWRAVSPPPAPSNEPFAIVPQGFGAQLTYEKIDRAQCVAKGDRIWVAHSTGFDCMTVFGPPAGSPQRVGETALVFLDGDVPEEDQTSAGEARMRATYSRLVSVLTERYKLPVYVVARPGLLGSSGSFASGGRRDEGFVIDATLDELKRLNSHRGLVLAGQSGGSRVIAQLLGLGRRDIACAVMGSGAYDIPRLKGGGRTAQNIFGDPGRRYLVPMREIANIPAVSTRRLFVIGDPRDTITPFAEQKAWAEALDKLGHHVVLVEAQAEGAEHHGMTSKALAAAGACAAGRPDAEVVSAARGAGTVQ